MERWRIKKEVREGKESKKGRYYHIMPDIGLGDEAGSEEDDETEEQHKSKEEALTMLTAFADSGAINHYCREIICCDGSNVSKTMGWLRSIDQLPKSVQMTVARLTARDPVLASLKQYSQKGITWPIIKVNLAYNYISADFCCLQRDRLRELTQKAGESVRPYLKAHSH